MKRTPGATPSEREAYWTDIISKARRYPKGITAYCLANNISKNNYYDWFKRLRLKHPEWCEDLNKPGSTKQAGYDKRAAIASQKAKVPPSEVSERPTRRQFSAAYKAKILREAETASAGQLGALLRREGLYTSHLQKWRNQRDQEALSPKKRGPKTNPLTAENKRLQAENEKLQKKLKQANAIIELQKKVSEILGISLQQSDEER